MKKWLSVLLLLPFFAAAQVRSISATLETYGYRARNLKGSGIRLTVTQPDGTITPFPLGAEGQIPKIVNGRIEWAADLSGTGGTSTETDPTVASHIKAITTTKIANWDSAYAKRVVSLAVTGTTTRTVAITLASGATISTNFQAISTEADPVYTASAAASVTNTRITQWNTAYTFSQLFDLTSAATGSVIKFDGTRWVAGTDLQGTGGPGPSTEVDPVYTAAPAAGITTSRMSNWDVAFNKRIVSHAVTGASSARTLTTTLSDGNTVSTTFTALQAEADPLYAASPASGVTTTRLTNWDAAYAKRLSTVQVTGTTTKTVRLNLADGTFASTTFTDLQGTGSAGTLGVVGGSVDTGLVTKDMVAIWNEKQDAAPYAPLTPSGGILSWDMSVATKITTTLPSNTTLAVSGGKNGSTYVARIWEDATGGRTLTFPVGWKVSGTLSTTASRLNEVVVEYDGITYSAKINVY